MRRFASEYDLSLSTHCLMSFQASCVNIYKASGTPLSSVGFTPNDAPSFLRLAYCAWPEAQTCLLETLD